MNQLSNKIASSCKNKTFSQETIQDILELLEEQYPYYQNFDYLGDGRSSIILKATNKENQFVAMKVVTIQKNIVEIESVEKEYYRLQQTNKCSYFVSVNSFFYLREAGKQKYFIIEMELCKNSLGQFLENLRKDKINLDDRVKNILTIQMLDAIHMLHKKEIVHKDIKPTNILISHNITFQDTPFILKLGDLGIPSQLKDSNSSQKGANYMSIEAYQGKQRKESDLFSLGIVLIELDNYLTFDYLKVSDLDFSLLQREGILALSKYEINRKSELFEIASIFLNTNYKQRQSALDVLERFLQKQQYSTITVYSIITEEMITQSQLQLEIPIHLNKKIQQIEAINSSIQEFTAKNAKNVEGGIQAEFLKKMQIFMKKNQSVLKELNKMEQEYFFSPENIKLAIKSLYEQKRFSLFSLLGKGANGIVFSVRNMIEMRDSVIKLCLGNDKIQIMRQISALKKVSSPYILKLYDFGFFSDEKENEYVWFEFEKCLCTLSHFLDQNMEDVQNNPKLKEIFSLQIIDSVNSLHRSGVLHGDIHLDNFLVSSDQSGGMIIKLTDFIQSGILNQFQYESYQNEDDLQKDKDKFIEGRNCLFQREKYGTPVFSSPQRSLSNGFPLTFISESFSVGLCLLLLDNYCSLEKVFVQNYFFLLQPYSVPFINCHHLINKNNQIYKWIFPLLSFHQSSRLYLREIIDEINHSPIPLYSRFTTQKSLNAINLQESSCLQLINMDCSQIINLMNTTDLSPLSLLTIELCNNNIQSEGIIDFSIALLKKKITFNFSNLSNAQQNRK